jgi:hypothetical protein
METMVKGTGVMEAWEATITDMDLMKGAMEAEAEEIIMDSSGHPMVIGVVEVMDKVMEVMAMEAIDTIMNSSLISANGSHPIPKAMAIKLRHRMSGENSGWVMFKDQDENK